jgi:hypothetical protein
MEAGRMNDPGLWVYLHAIPAVPNVLALKTKPLYPCAALGWIVIVCVIGEAVCHAKYTRPTGSARGAVNSETKSEDELYWVTGVCTSFTDGRP